MPGKKKVLNKLAKKQEKIERKIREIIYFF